MISRFLVILATGIFMAARLAFPAEPVPPPSPGQTFALLVGGMAGQEPYNQWYNDWEDRFQKYLVNTAGVPAANVTVLSGNKATAESIILALEKLSRQVKPQDQFILFIVGHGELNSGNPTLMLPGPDLSVDKLSAALDSIPSKDQVILNLSASSGDFLKHIVSPVRVNITATSPTELNEPVFAEFFLRGLESKRANPDKNGGDINLLQAYNWAAQQTALWIVRWQQTGPDKITDSSDPTTWKANGKETIEIFEKLYAKVPTRKLDPSSNRNAEDAALELVPPNGDVTGDWAGRRVVDEHALLEDCGQEIGVSMITDKGFQPILGAKPGDPGYAAGHTVLGKPAPLNQ